MKKNPQLSNLPTSSLMLFFSVSVVRDNQFSLIQFKFLRLSAMSVQFLPPHAIIQYLAHKNSYTLYIWCDKMKKVRKILSSFYCFATCGYNSYRFKKEHNTWIFIKKPFISDYHTHTYIHQ